MAAVASISSKLIWNVPLLFYIATPHNSISFTIPQILSVLHNLLHENIVCFGGAHIDCLEIAGWEEIRVPYMTCHDHHSWHAIDATLNQMFRVLFMRLPAHNLRSISSLH